MATRAKKSQRIKRSRKDPLALLALSITTPSQVRNGKFVACDVANHADEDQRHMVRSGERQTIRRKPKFEELRDRGVISDREALACQWYHDAHEARYATTGITQRYGTFGGGGSCNFDHLPKSRIQQEAFDHFEFARSGINPFFLPMFERIILHGRPLGRLRITFRTAVRQLLEQIEGKVAL